MLAALRSGDWLTEERLRVYPRLLLAATALAVVVWVVMADGLIDPNGKPLGTDFSNVYSAGRMVLEGQAPAAYDPEQHYAAQRQVFGGRDVPFYGWHYPPMFLGVAALLALLPYGAALLAWMALTLPAYLASIRAILPGAQTLVPALAFPAVFVNLGHGQNGFLTAALLGGALVLLKRRPVLAGLLIGLLSYKPQFGLLIPLVLIVGGHWRAFASAAATVLAISAAAFALFGVDVWMAFVESMSFTRSVVLEAGNTGWHKIQSVFSAVRMWGGSVETAYAVQTGLALALAAALVWLWRSPAAFALKAAALATACLLATPYVLDYDMVVLAVAIAFMAAHGRTHGFLAWEKTGLVAVWAAPLVARSLTDLTLMPVGTAAMLVLFALTLRRAAHDLAAHQPERSQSLAQA